MENLSAAECIEKYNLPLKTDDMVEADLAEAPYVLIRHGLSTFNLAARIAKEEFGQDSAEFKAVEQDPKLIDPELHPVGILQCEAH